MAIEMTESSLARVERERDFYRTLLELGRVPSKLQILLLLHEVDAVRLQLVDVDAGRQRLARIACNQRVHAATRARAGRRAGRG